MRSDDETAKPALLPGEVTTASVVTSLIPAARGLTVARLLDHLARMPGDAEVVVNASDGDVEVFALVKAVEYEPTCGDGSVCRIYADQEDDDAC